MVDTGPLLLDFAERQPEAFARELSGHSVDELTSIISNLPAEQRVDILARLPGALIDEVILAVPDFGRHWLTPAPLERISELLSRLPRSRRLALIETVDNTEKRRRLLRQQQYPPHAIGSLIVDVPLRVVETARAADVVRAIRDLGHGDPGLLLVISADGSYRGVLDPWPLLTNTREARLADHVVRVKPLLPEVAAVDAADDERWNEYAWLPVADHEGHILGRVARSRVLRAAREETADALRRQDFVTSLFAEFVHLCGGIVERLLARTARR